MLIIIIIVLLCLFQGTCLKLDSLGFFFNFVCSFMFLDTSVLSLSGSVARLTYGHSSRYLNQNQMKAKSTRSDWTALKDHSFLILSNEKKYLI